MLQATVAQKALLIKGEHRDKEGLIRTAKAVAQNAFRVQGQIRVVYISDHIEQLNGYVVVVEFEPGCGYNPPGSGRKSLRR